MAAHVAGPVLVVALQDRSTYVNEPGITQQYHVAADGSTAILWNGDTFETAVKHLTVPWKEEGGVRL